ncbi:MAG: hypothetical protein LBS84_00240 [Clostridiales bacterium]|jgi:hypothetical protein|nr:hypothetical protein [Clostridiales bacterium]
MEREKPDNPAAKSLSAADGTIELLDRNEPFTDNSTHGRVSVTPTDTKIQVTAEKTARFDQILGVMPEILVNLNYPPFLFVLDAIWLAAAIFTPVNLIRLTAGVISPETINKLVIIFIISITVLLLIPYIFIRRGGGHLLVGVNTIDSLLHITWALPFICAGSLAFLTVGFNAIFLIKAIIWGQVFIAFFWLALTALAWWFSAEDRHGAYLEQFHLKMAVGSAAVCCVTDFLLASVR